MNENATGGIEQKELDEIYARLRREDVEEFYASYSQWAQRHQALELRKAIAEKQRQIEVNATLLQQARPSVVALAALARLQANGVSDDDLLDRMLERGEAWLDVTMQRLDYCEQLENFMSDDYEHWCRHALEGAYDWLDSLLQEPEAETASAKTTSPLPSNEEEIAEELLLAKLAGDGEEAEYADPLLDITQKRPAITPAQLQTLAAEHIEPEQVEQVGSGDANTEEADETLDSESGVEEQPSGEGMGGRPQGYGLTRAEEPDMQEYIVLETAPGEEDLSTPGEEQPALQEFAPVQEMLSSEHTNTESKEPALQEFAHDEETISIEDRREEGGEPLIQEFPTVTDPLSAEEVTRPNVREAEIREYSTPAEVAVVEEGDDESHAPERPEYQEESSGPVDTLVTGDVAGREEPAAAMSMPASQWEWQKPPEATTIEGPVEAQEDEPKPRSHFIWRLLAKIWGR
ncbi:MAG TPA: hypothetical protein VKV20_01210 [Ktedonobacteraceae bacterium]|jgi:hypothetical protein|nr:hypothetical protein [Ktedonobacteraceae bacterium]